MDCGLTDHVQDLQLGVHAKDKNYEGKIELEVIISVYDLRVLRSVYKQFITGFPSSQDTQ